MEKFHQEIGFILNYKNKNKLLLKEAYLGLNLDQNT
jgi:hypothetical protein